MSFLSGVASGMAGSMGGGNGLLSNLIQKTSVGQSIAKAVKPLKDLKGNGLFSNLMGNNQEQTTQPGVAPAASSYPMPDVLREQMPDAYKIAQSLGAIESSGNYNAIGPRVNNDNAFGKYQIMGYNIPKWSKQALGREVSTEEFRNDPNLQDRVAMYQINSYLQQGYSPQDVASLWLSGRPLQGNNAKDKATGISVPSYVERFNKHYYGNFA